MGVERGNLADQAELSGLPPCSVAIKCADDMDIVRCLDSIDDPEVAVNAVITPSERVEALLRERGVPFVLTEYGNIAKSAQLSVEAAEHDNVIVMDSDVYFAPGAIRLMRAALLHSPVVKPALRFEDDGSYFSRLVAGSRNRYNDVPNKAINPGLALRRREVAARCGELIFNPHIRWTEDADLNYRLQREGVPVQYVPEAEVWHGPVSLKHELRCGFLYGVGKRLSVEHNPDRIAREDPAQLFRTLTSPATYAAALERARQNGIPATLLAGAWRTLYYAGYYAQKHSQRWTLEEDRARR